MSCPLDFPPCWIHSLLSRYFLLFYVENLSHLMSYHLLSLRSMIQVVMILAFRSSDESTRTVNGFCLSFIFLGISVDVDGVLFDRLGLCSCCSLYDGNNTSRSNFSLWNELNLLEVGVSCPNRGILCQRIGSVYFVFGAKLTNFLSTGNVIRMIDPTSLIDLYSFL